MNLQLLKTEQKNIKTLEIDKLDSLGIAKLMNDEDRHVAEAVQQELETIAQVINMAAGAIEKGGRVIYAGAGTSGRLGILDASEIPPTFNAPPHYFIGLIAGGEPAIRSSVEGAEDNELLGAEDIRNLDVQPNDLVIGLAASGRTPYVGGALREARARGARTALIACNKQAALSPFVDAAIEVEVGAEVIMGSTRLKAGTAQKMVLNMISTGTMIMQGKVYGNLMVDLQTKNAKLRDRAIRIITEATGSSYEAAASAYEQSGYLVKAAIVHLLTGDNVVESKQRLERAGGRIREALETPV